MNNNNNKNTKVLYSVGGVIIGLTLALVFLPMMRFGESSSFGNDSTSTPRTTIMASTIDRHFIEQMIPHHEGAIAMANLALEKANRPEVRALAQAIVSAQESENKQMKRWYKDWFGTDVPNANVVMGGMMSQGGMHMGSSQDMDELKNAVDFDKEFIEQMIPHHQMAIMMANMLKAGSSEPEMQQLAKNIISSQTKEIQQMQGWYEIWYK